MIVAHRGASGDAPENTLPSFTLAWELGADAIEGDFQLTRDGHIVCIHDKDTQRVAGRKLVVEESTLADLRELDVGAYRGNDYKGCMIPTIAEVFSTIPEQRKIYIEIKCGIEIIPALLDEIEISGLRREQIVVISFNEKVLQRIKSKAPQYKVYWLSALKWDGSGNIAPSTETILDTLDLVGADGLSSGKDVITESIVGSVLEKGYEYHVWTVDDIETAKRFRKWGARSITTNIPGYIRKHLLEQDTSAGADKLRR